MFYIVAGGVVVFLFLIEVGDGGVDKHVHVLDFGCFGFRGRAVTFMRH